VWVVLDSGKRGAALGIHGVHGGQAWCRPWHPRRPDSVHTAWYSPHSDGPASVTRSGARCLRMHAIASCPSSSSTQVTKNRNTCHPNATFTTLRRSPVIGSRSSPPRVLMPLAACAPTCKASILDHAALLCSRCLLRSESLERNVMGYMHPSMPPLMWVCRCHGIPRTSSHQRPIPNQLLRHSLPHLHDLLLSDAARFYDADALAQSPWP